MENLIDQAISEAINLACERISCNDKCDIECYAIDNETEEDAYVTLDIDYTIHEGSQIPWEDPTTIHINSIHMTIDDKIVNPYEYGVTKEYFT